MVRSNIAIIGSGIAGLTCARRLAGHHQVTLFEAGATPGGHTATVDVATPQGTGPSIPDLSSTTIAPIRALWACSASWGSPGKTQMSSRSTTRPAAGVQRPQPDLALRPAAQSAEAGLLGTAERDRPLQPAGETGADRGAGSVRDAGELPHPPPLQPLLRPPLYSADGGGHLVVVAAGDAPLPAAAVLRFFENHGLLDIRDRPQWYVVPGGSGIRPRPARRSAIVWIYASTRRCSRWTATRRGHPAAGVRGGAF